MDDFRNPHHFKLISDKFEQIPNSPLIRIGLAVNSSRHYAAAVDPGTKKNYVLHANVLSQGPRFTTSYTDIADEREHKAASDYFLKCGCFERYYKFNNWLWEVRDHRPVQSRWASRRKAALKIAD